MLSRRQSWRKLDTRPSNFDFKLSNQPKIICGECSDDFKNPLRILAEESYSPSSSLSSASFKPRLRFSETTDVFLIPTRQELSLYKCDIYYAIEDLHAFHVEALVELYDYSNSPECRRKRNHMMRQGILTNRCHLCKCILFSTDDSVENPVYRNTSALTYLHTCHCLRKPKSRNHLFVHAQCNQLKSYCYHTPQAREIIELIFNQYMYDIQSPRIFYHTQDSPCTLHEAMVILYQPWRAFNDYYYEV